MIVVLLKRVGNADDGEQLGEYFLFDEITLLIAPYTSAIW